MTRRSLGIRMVLLFGALLAAIGVFMVWFFPARMAEQAETQAEQRATSIVQVMSTALGPAIEFDDADNAATILGWVGTAPDARFAVVRGGTGKRFAAWHAEAIPATQSWPDHPATEVDGHIMLITLPIHGNSDGHGTLHVGFSLEQLEEERDQTRETVAITSLLVFAAGLLGTLLFAAIVVRPIRKLSSTARKIATGKLPPVMPDVGGGDEVAELAASLRAMLEKLNQESQNELVRASRHAGMAEVATGVLHNVGNVLTSVNVSLELLRERTRDMPIARLRKLGELLGKAQSLDRDKLAVMRDYVAVITEAFAQFQQQATRDLDGFGNHVEHIKRVVASQNAYARARSVVESTQVAALVAEAIELGCPAARRGDISIEVDVAPDLEAAIPLDRHRILQILVNLTTNARDAVSGGGTTRPEIRIVATRDHDRLSVSVTDNGVGIAAEQQARIFNAGFTSKPRGHGYGLHSSALTARQLGGALGFESSGEGRGARFTVTVPIAEAT